MAEGISLEDYNALIRRHQEREEAWRKLVRYLTAERGFAPPWGVRGLWVDLYDEATGEWGGAHSDGTDHGP